MSSSSISSSSFSNKISVILRSPADWDEWFFIVKNRAVSLGVWDFVNPALANMPAQPTEPAPILPSDAKTGALYFSDLETADREFYRLLLDHQSRQTTKFEKQKSALADLSNLVLSTISREKLSIVTETTTPYETLRASNIVQ